uniref:Uncharacterized protein n=1 Tax=Ipomoea trifida TaxID=35884 RepID=A0A8Y1_IPOTF|nr:hypothetical protein [Ipomoea trifida]
MILRLADCRLRSEVADGRLIRIIIFPLADAIHYQNNDVVSFWRHMDQNFHVHLNLLRFYSPMHVQNACEISEYEIDPKELDFINSGTFCIASWRGTQVAVKRFGEALFMGE